MRARVIAGALLVAVMAACGSDSDTTSTPAADPTSSATTSTASPTSPSATASEEPAADVVLSSFRFAPDQVTVTSGDDLALLNASTSSSHSFTVTGQDIDVILDAQTEADVTIDLEAGTYPFICKFHESAGMVGTLVVEPVAA